MKTILFTLLVSFIGIHTHAHLTAYEQLCAFNPNWKKYPSSVPTIPAIHFKHDWQLVQFHLLHVLRVLDDADISDLTIHEKTNRARLIETLSTYCTSGKFPINTSSEKRTPVFIDAYDTHCAVGYLLKESGYGAIARDIAFQQNLAWVPEIKSDELLRLQQQSGLSLEEVKLIQGAYDFYAPGALTAYNKYEIPQQPQVIDRQFDDKGRTSRHNRKSGQWLYGAEKDGVLHGKWIQNYSADLPWIVGYYKNGKRTGQWKEYYKGTDILCRTENWRNDQLNGIRTRYDRNGKVIETIQFKNGQAVLKTNFDARQGIKWVRKPLGGDTVFTQVFDENGALLAAGNETVYNPGNLEWFQNIELTALNTMAIQARDQVTSNGLRQSQFQSFTPLVEYHKQGDWELYARWQSKEEITEKYGLENMIRQYYQPFFDNFRQLTYCFDQVALKAPFDSLQIQFKNNQVLQFHGYGQEVEKHYAIAYFEREIAPTYQFKLRETSAIIPIQHYSSSRIRRPIFTQPIARAIKAYGELDRIGNKIGKWTYLNKTGNKVKETVFYVPEPFPEPYIKTKTAAQLAVNRGSSH